MGRKAVWLSVLGLFFGLALAAQEGPKTMTVNGQLVSIDAKAATVVVKADAASGPARDLSFGVGPKTKILKDGNTVALADLKPGDKVSVEYESVSGKNMALAIGVVPHRTT